MTFILALLFSRNYCCLSEARGVLSIYLFTYLFYPRKLYLILQHCSQNTLSFSQRPLVFFLSSRSQCWAKAVHLCKWVATIEINNLRWMSHKCFLQASKLSMLLSRRNFPNCFSASGFGFPSLSVFLIKTLSLVREHEQYYSLLCRKKQTQKRDLFLISQYSQKNFWIIVKVS